MQVCIYTYVVYMCFKPATVPSIASKLSERNMLFANKICLHIKAILKS